MAAIDVGSTASDRDTYAGLYIVPYYYTQIDYNNAANLTGIINTVKAWFKFALPGNSCKVGTFAQSDTTTFTCNDAESIGEVASGSEQTFSGLSIDINSGEYIGADGRNVVLLQLEAATSGGGGIYGVTGQQYCDPADSGTLTLDANCILSLNGTGTTVTIPIVTTQAVSSIGTTTATGNGNITATGGENASAWGTCLSVNANPTTADTVDAGSGAGGVGAFTTSITGLTPGTLYHVRAYATNSAGTSYGADVTFRATYDETGKIQTILVTVEKTEAATFSEIGKSQTILASHGVPSQVFTANEVAKVQTVLAVSEAPSEIYTMGETGKLQTILAVLNESDLATFTEKEKEQIILVALTEADLATFTEKEKLQLLLAVITGDAHKLYTETEKEQIILATLDKSEQLIKGEVGREQVVLGVIGQSDMQTMLETAHLQIVLSVITEEESATRSETGREQIILAVQGETDVSLFSELGKTQTILVVVAEADTFFRYIAALKYVLELHNSDGDLVAILENAHDISYSQMINSPFALSFALPASDAKVSNILLSNEIWLRDYKSGAIIKKFRLSIRRDIRRG